MGLQKDQLRQAMLAADRDGDGTISKDEMPDLLKGSLAESCEAQTKVGQCCPIIR